MQVLISIPTNRDHKPLFTSSLAEMIGHIHNHGKNYGLEGYTLNMGYNQSELSHARQTAITIAQRDSCTHILWIDNDSAFPGDALQILASRKVDAIGVNFVGKTTTFKPVAFDFNGQGIDSKSKTGIEEVKHVGMGMFLLDVNALKNIPAPHFEVLWNYDIGDYTPEDKYFCEKLKKHGIKIYVDHDLSLKVGHIGDYVYNQNSWK